MEVEHPGSISGCSYGRDCAGLVYLDVFPGPVWDGQEARDTFCTRLLPILAVGSDCPEALENANAVAHATKDRVLIVCTGG